MVTRSDTTATSHSHKDDIARISSGAQLKWTDRVIVYLEGVLYLQLAFVDPINDNELKVKFVEG